jgi:arginyl-tRNA synthetase
MSTLDVDGLAQILGISSVSELPDKIQDVSVLTNPLDVWRSVLATLLAGLVNAEVFHAYKSIQWPNNIFNGDLSVTLPRLRPGCKATELSSELVDKVCL